MQWGRAPGATSQGRGVVVTGTGQQRDYMNARMTGTHTTHLSTLIHRSRNNSSAYQRLRPSSAISHAGTTDEQHAPALNTQVKKNNSSAYQRLRALCANAGKRFFVFANEHHRDTAVEAVDGESPNDRNDRALRVATRWYGERVPQVRCARTGCRTVAVPYCTLVHRGRVEGAQESWGVGRFHAGAASAGRLYQ